jgi:hypothetical protein
VSSDAGEAWILLLTQTPKLSRSSRMSVLSSLDDDRDYDPSFDPDFDPDGFVEPENVAERRDPVVDQAKDDLRNFFAGEPESVFYQRQLQVIFEKKYFHWITSHALSELAQEGSISAQSLPLSGTGTATGTITVYRPNAYRYWKRQADEIVKLVSRFSQPPFTAALGAQGEMMFDAALSTFGFMPIGRKVRTRGELQWSRSGHDLDRVFERDGVAYGTEIKNTLGYIERSELEIKVAMCHYLGLRPLFIVRMAPKSYVNFVEQEGGFTLIFKYQLYPFGEKTFADEVRTKLRLPVDSPLRIEEGTVKRLADWHVRKLKKLGG